MTDDRSPSRFEGEISDDSSLERREINQIIVWALNLPILVRFELLDVLRKDLSASILSDDNSEGQVIDERRKSLDVLRQVCEHLELDADQLPTARQFDEATKELGLKEWNRGRMVRLWGSWRVAKSSYSGTWNTHLPGNPKLRRK
jgi:hypothetical protein